MILFLKKSCNIYIYIYILLFLLLILFSCEEKTPSKPEKKAVDKPVIDEPIAIPKPIIDEKPIFDPAGAKRLIKEGKKLISTGIPFLQTGVGRFKSGNKKGAISSFERSTDIFKKSINKLNEAEKKDAKNINIYTNRIPASQLLTHSLANTQGIKDLLIEIKFCMHEKIERLNSKIVEDIGKTKEIDKNVYKKSKYKALEGQVKNYLKQLANYEETKLMPNFRRHKIPVPVCIPEARKHYDEGVEYNNSGRYSEALKSYQEAIKIVPDHVKVIAEIGAIKYNLKRYEEAIKDFDKSLRLYPDHEYAYLLRGKAYERLKKYDEALADFAKVLSFKGGGYIEDDRNKRYKALAYEGQGNVKAHQGDTAEAITNYDEVIKLDPTKSEAWRKRGHLKTMRLKKHEEAIADLSKAIELDSTNPEAYYARHYAYWHLKNYKKALADLKKAIEIKPSMKNISREIYMKQIRELGRTR